MFSCWAINPWIIVRPLPLVIKPVQQAAFGENAEHCLHVHRAVLLARRERQLEGGTLHVIDQDVQVVGIDQRVLG